VKFDICGLFLLFSGYEVLYKASERWPSRFAAISPFVERVIQGLFVFVDRKRLKNCRKFQQENLWSGAV
jgi:hypothetical protein